MKLRGISIDIDYRTELEKYDWRRATWRPEKLIACSPFRYESSPSFYVYLEDTDTASAGNWQDSGGFDSEYGRGGFVRLLAYLRNESEDETIDYLLEEYSAGYIPEERMTLKPHIRFTMEAETHFRREDARAKMKALGYRHPYLAHRGVSEEVQRMYRIGFDRDSKAVALPWIDARGNLITIKYRSVIDKKFWYDAEGFDITAHLFGIYEVYRDKPKTLVLVEAEIDALYLRTAGVYAVATGNRFFSKERADLLRKLGVERLIIGADADSAGQEMRDRVIRALRAHVDLYDWRLPSGCKDINDVKDIDEVRRIIDEVRPIHRMPSLM